MHLWINRNNILNFITSYIFTINMSSNLQEYTQYPVDQAAVYYTYRLQYNKVQIGRGCKNLWIGKEVARLQEKTNIL